MDSQIESNHYNFSSHMMVSNESFEWVDTMDQYVLHTHPVHEESTMPIYHQKFIPQYHYADEQPHQEHQHDEQEVQQQQQYQYYPQLVDSPSPPASNFASPQQRLVDSLSPSMTLTKESDLVSKLMPDELRKRKPGRKPKALYEALGFSPPTTTQGKVDLKLHRNRVAAGLSRRRRKERLDVMEIYSQKLCLANYELKGRVIQLLQLKSSIGMMV